MVNRNPPWWHFWNPYSGGPGGIIAFVVLYAIVVGSDKLLRWFGL